MKEDRVRIAVLTGGTRGDVQPFLALSLGLKKSGHEVRLVADECFESLIKGYKVDFRPFKSNVTQLMLGEIGTEMIGKGINPLKLAQEVKRGLQSSVEQIAVDCLKACKDIEVIFTGTFAFFIGVPVAEKLKIPYISCWLQPVLPTRAFGSIFLPPQFRNIGNIGNLLTHFVIEQVFWQTFRCAVNKMRCNVLELPPWPFRGPLKALHLSRYPIFCAFSPLVVQPPCDWNKTIYLTGYWFLDSPPEWKPPKNLVRFLDAGEPPLYIGFGSMDNHESKKLVDIALEALEVTQQRGIVATSLQEQYRGAVPDTIFITNDIPHDWLFPKMKALIHHGGAGTIAAGLKAGVPMITVPHISDQEFWGNCMKNLGIASEPILRKELTVEKLVRAIDAALSDISMRKRVVQLSQKIRDERGVTTAIEVFHQTIGS